MEDAHSDSQPWIVALGGNELNAGLLAVAERRDAKVLVVDWNEKPDITGDAHLQLDIKDEAAVLDALTQRIERLLFAYTSSDAGTETAAQIHATYGLARPPAASAHQRQAQAHDEFDLEPRGHLQEAILRLKGPSRDHCFSPPTTVDHQARSRQQLARGHRDPP